MTCRLCQVTSCINTSTHFRAATVPSVSPKELRYLGDSGRNAKIIAGTMAGIAMTREKFLHPILFREKKDIPYDANNPEFQNIVMIAIPQFLHDLRFHVVVTGGSYRWNITYT